MMPKVVEKAAIGQGSKQRFVSCRIDYLLQGDMVERLMLKLSSVDGGDELLFD